MQEEWKMMKNVIYTTENKRNMKKWNQLEKKTIKKSFIKTNGAVTENIDVIFCDCY